MSKLFRFPGGIHPQEGQGGKKITSVLPIEDAPLPSRVAIPLSQHIGAPAKPLVQKGDTVKVGQMIGEPGAAMSAAVHASVSGKVVDVTPVLLANGTQTTAVIIDNDFNDDWVELTPYPNPDSITMKEISDIARTMGIVGMGGATFPTGIKVSIPEGKKADTLILNGVECEPYLSADHRLMLESTREILLGAQLVKKALGIGKVIVGIELNKPDAIEAMKAECAGLEGFEVAALPVRYPQGGEKQLIYAVTGRTVRMGALPLSVGCIVMNVGTCHALYRAVYEGRPLIDRIVTVGGLVNKPANYRARIGTPVEWLVDTSKGMKSEAKVLLSGGPMMGTPLCRMDVPITKGTSGILALPHARGTAKPSACIRCGRCLKACPMKLQPALIDRLMHKDMFDEAAQMNVLNCIECGACSFSCPAHRELTQSMRVCKKIITQRQKAAAAKKGAK